MASDLIKNYAKDWYAFKNWSFEFIKNLDPNLMVNAIIGGNMYTSGEKKFVNIKLQDYIQSIISGDSKAYLSTFHLFSKFSLAKDFYS